VTTARRILAIEPQFDGYHLIDLDESKAAAMKEACKARPQAVAHCGDANSLLPALFKTIRYDEYKRALCFLDPYKVLLSWNVLQAAGSTRTIEAFINFPTLDIQRNVLRKDPAKIVAAQAADMTLMWGDESWRKVAYAEQPTLFGPIETKQTIDPLLEAFRARLKSVAGFKHVTKALPMRNTAGAIVYHLLFATQQSTALRIATEVLESEAHPRR
jgi:three-Cys-motif partner protein